MLVEVVKPELLRWARDRAGLDPDHLAKRFPKLHDWETGRAFPTFKQLQDYAAATYAPFGYFFLPEPPEEKIPLADFRTMPGERPIRPSVNLLDTIYLCQQRQDWYREYALSMGEDQLPFVGSAKTSSSVAKIAEDIRHAVGLDIPQRAAMRTWEEALRAFMEGADASGVLVMKNGIVQNNTHRKLNPEEFRGFAIADEHAPLVFINGADTKSGQMFTLAHELAHIWLGETGVSNEQPTTDTNERVERWCNEVAAEVLVPIGEFEKQFQRRSELRSEVSRLAGRFKVSTLVILRRVHDVGALTRKQFHDEYAAELKRLPPKRESSGGDFYRTALTRIGKRLARALVSSTLEGHTLYTDAFRLLSVKKQAAFDTLATELGMGVLA